MRIATFHAETCGFLVPEPPNGYDFDIPTCWDHISEDEKSLYRSEVKEIIDEHPDTCCPVCMEGIDEILDTFKLRCCKNFICEKCLIKNHLQCPLCSVIHQGEITDNFWVDYSLDKFNDLSMERLTILLEEEANKKKTLLENIRSLKVMKETSPGELNGRFDSLIDSLIGKFVEPINVKHQILPSFREAEITPQKGKDPLKVTEKEISKKRIPKKIEKPESEESECGDSDCEECIASSSVKKVVKAVKRLPKK